jgi:hypothetical protein
MQVLVREQPQGHDFYFGFFAPVKQINNFGGTCPMSASGRRVTAFGWICLRPPTIAIEHYSDVMRGLREIELTQYPPLIQGIER